MIVVGLIVGAVIFIGVIKLVFWALQDPAWVEQKRNRKKFLKE